jgi:succinate dehydrogenase / fumarate reductase cytochrome b subunit
VNRETNPKVYIMNSKNRPLSPHIQIYRPQMTTVLSIVHRLTGVGLVAGCLIMTWWLFAAISGQTAFEQTQAFRDSPIGTLIFAGWLWAFVYHFLNGIRHLKWDTGRGINMKSAYRSGWVVVIGSVLLTILIWLSIGVKA